MANVERSLHDGAAAVQWTTLACRLGLGWSCYRLIELGRDLPGIPGNEKRSLYKSGCDVQIPSACDRLAELDRDEERVVATMLEVVAKRDIAAFAKLIPDAIQVDGVWFDSADCAKQFSSEFVLDGSTHVAFLNCLATLDLGIAQQTHFGGFELVYEPGVTLSIGAWDGAIHRLSSTLRSLRDATAAPISSDVLVSHMIAGTRAVEPDQEVRDTVAKSPVAFVYAHLLVCVDPAGNPTEITVVDRSEGHDRYIRAIEAAATSWRFRPFLVRGRAVRVCAFDPVGYPPDRLPRFAPLRMAPRPTLPDGPGAVARSPTDPRNVAPTVLDAHRISGEKNIVPDDQTKWAFTQSRRPALIGSFKLCIRYTGDISSVTMLKTTGYTNYDRKLVRKIYEWRYTPFLVNGKPTPVCTAVTFIYR